MANEWISLLKGGVDPSDMQSSFQANYDAGVKTAQSRRVFDQAQQGRAAMIDALKTGDYKKAAAIGFAYGDEKAGTGFTTLQKNGFDQGTAGTTSFGNVAAGIATHPYEQRRAAIQAVKPMLVARGMNAADVDNFDPTDDSLAALTGLDYSQKDRDSAAVASQNATTGALNAQAAITNANNPVIIDGSLVTRGGQEIFRAPKNTVAGIDQSVIRDPGVSSTGYVSQPVQNQNWLGGPITAEQLYFGAIRPQESGNRPGVVGQPTKWGTAKGAGQLLDSTAQGVAKKLGLPWRPDLMTSTSPEAVKYQDTLGVGYAQEALAASGGDPRGAAAYYFGGPDPAQHGPRTRRYADEVMGRLDQSVGTRANAAGGASGLQVVQQGVPKDTLGLNAAGGGIDTDAIHSMAIDYISTGKLPPLGNGATGVKLAIQSEVASILKQNGYSPDDLGAFRANYKASGAALANQQKVFTVIKSSENTALQSMDNLIAARERLGAGNHSRLVNGVQMGWKRFNNDPDVQAFDTYAATIQSEYAKVMTTTSGGGNAPLTDSARHEMARLLNPNGSLESMKAARDAMAKDMAAKTGSWETQIDHLDKQLRTSLDRPKPKPQPWKPGTPIPTDAVARLKANPATAAKFDRVFGQGAAARVLGR